MSSVNHKEIKNGFEISIQQFKSTGQFDKMNLIEINKQSIKSNNNRPAPLTNKRQLNKSRKDQWNHLPTHGMV